MEGQPFHEKKNLKVDTRPKDASANFLAQEYAATPRAVEPQDDKDPFEGRVDGLYLVLISLHGLVRGERMELGKDPDTGGQVSLHSVQLRGMSRCSVRTLIDYCCCDEMNHYAQAQLCIQQCLCSLRSRWRPVGTHGWLYTSAV